MKSKWINIWSSTIFPLSGNGWCVSEIVRFVLSIKYRFFNSFVVKFAVSWKWSSAACWLKICPSVVLWIFTIIKQIWAGALSTRKQVDTKRSIRVTRIDWFVGESLLEKFSEPSREKFDLSDILLTGFWLNELDCCRSDGWWLYTTAFLPTISAFAWKKSEIRR